MSKSFDTIEHWMTRNPRAIDHGASLSEAHAIMRNEAIRHLPVMEKGRLVGIVSQRDLHLIETLKEVDPDQVSVREAMTSHPYVVAPCAPLAEVVSEMAEHKFGAAIVLKGKELVGMFTTVDAMIAFARFLQTTQVLQATQGAGGRGEEAAPTPPLPARPEAKPATPERRRSAGTQPRAAAVRSGAATSASAGRSRERRAT